MPSKILRKETIGYCWRIKSQPRKPSIFSRVKRISSLFGGFANNINAAEQIFFSLLRRASARTQTSSRAPQDEEGHSMPYAAEIFIRFSTPILNCREEWLAQALASPPRFRRDLLSGAVRQVNKVVNWESEQALLCEGDYSLRSATIGSTFAARRAGIQQASKATAVSNSAIAANVTGSVALTPKSRVLIVRVNAS